MNIPYKFRGIDEDGKYVYGDYVTRENGCAIRFKEKKTLIKIYVYEVTVKPETVAQLIGFDIDGKEIYEGDTLIDKDGNIWDKLEIYSDVDNAFTVQKYKLRLKN